MFGKESPFGCPGSTSTSNAIEVESKKLMKLLCLRSVDIGSPEGHSARVAEFSLAVGRRFDLDEPTMRALRSAAILHDIGKIQISSRIINKLGTLTDREFEIMRLHSVIAVRMLERIESLSDAVPMIRHHHERFDGKGYPDGLEGHDIPTGARIIAVAETFDILLTGAPWRSAITLNSALRELRRNSGTQFDPMVVEAFVASVRAGEVSLRSDEDEPEESVPDIKAPERPVKPN